VLFENCGVLIIRKVRPRIGLGYLILGVEFLRLDDNEADFSGEIVSTDSSSSSVVCFHLKTLPRSAMITSGTASAAADIKFGDSGEWTKSRMMQVQYHNITDAADLETWRGMSYQTVLTPPDQKTGDVIYPYEKAK